jgi:cold shock protein
MATGKVAYYNVDRGFGFLQPDDGDGDEIFVHINNCAESVGRLLVDQRVKFEVRPSRHKPGSVEAVDVVLV